MKTKIHYFLTLSIAAHLALFAVWRVTESETSHTASAIKLSLITIPSLSTIASPQSSKQQHKPGPSTTPEITETHHQIPAKYCGNNDCITIQNQHTSTPQLNVKTTDRQQSSEASVASVVAPIHNGHIQQQIHNAFVPHFSYPRIARRKGWQGTVELGLHVNAKGVLSHIHIINSSGYSVLDHAAINSLQQINSIPDAVSWLKGKDFDLIFPVQYQLLDT